MTALRSLSGLLLLCGLMLSACASSDSGSDPSKTALHQANREAEAQSLATAEPMTKQLARDLDEQQYSIP